MSGYFWNRDSLALGEVLRSYCVHFPCLCLFLLFGYSRQPLPREFESSDNTLLSTLCQNNHNRSFLKPSHRTNTFFENLSYPRLFAIQRNFRQKYNFTKCFYSSKPKPFNINLIYTFCLDAKRGLI